MKNSEMKKPASSISGNNKVFDFLNEIGAGILIINIEQKKVHFSNDQFKKISKGHSKNIINFIFESVNSNIKFNFNIEIPITDKLTFSYSIFPLSNGTGNCLVLINDISSNNIYLEIQKNKDFYNHLSSFASEIAHEAGNPITSVIMTLQVLLNNLGSWNQEKSNEYIQTSIKELNRLSEFLVNIRDISRDPDMESEEIELKSLVKMVIVQNKTDLAKKKIVVKEDIEDNVKVLVDPDALFSVLLNLFRNSTRILTEGKGVITLKVEEINKLFVKLVYQNNGPLITDRVIENMFLPVLNTRPGEENIGLERSLKLMTKMGGTIKVENLEKGKGVKFNLYIPIDGDGQYREC